MAYLHGTDSLAKLGLHEYSRYSVFVSNDSSAIFVFGSNHVFPKIQRYLKQCKHEFLVFNSTILASFCLKCLTLEDIWANPVNNCQIVALDCECQMLASQSVLFLSIVLVRFWRKRHALLLTQFLLQSGRSHGRSHHCPPEISVTSWSK